MKNVPNGLEYVFCIAEGFIDYFFRETSQKNKKCIGRSLPNICQVCVCTSQTIRQSIKCTRKRRV